MRWFLFLPFSLGFTMLAYVLAPVLPLFAKNGELPKWLSWFATPDNWLYGDAGHEARWSVEHSYLQQVAWLFRNPAYGFEWDGPLAATLKETDQIFSKGNPLIKNRFNAVSGWYFCRVGKYWNFKAVIPLFGDLCLMPEFGWKLQGFAQDREVEGKAMYVFSLRLTAFFKD